jgi:hypothetical protein
VHAATPLFFAPFFCAFLSRALPFFPSPPSSSPTSGAAGGASLTITELSARLLPATELGAAPSDYADAALSAAVLSAAAAAGRRRSDKHADKAAKGGGAAAATLAALFGGGVAGGGSLSSAEDAALLVAREERDGVGPQPWLAAARCVAR